MAIQLSVAVRNARLDAIEQLIGASPKLRYYSGAQPASCAAAEGGTMAVELTLPVDWMNAAAGGSKTLLGTWSGVAVANVNPVAHFRLYDSTGTTCHMQGSIGVGSGDMQIDNDNIAIGQTVTNNSFTPTDGNA